MASAVTGLVMSGTSANILIVSVLVLDPTTFVDVSVTLVVPTAAGVGTPLMVEPVSVKPGGSGAAVTVIGVVPEDNTTNEKPTPTVPVTDRF